MDYGPDILTIGARGRPVPGALLNSGWAPSGFSPVDIPSLVHRYRASMAQQPIAGGAASSVGDPVGLVPDEVGSDDLASPNTSHRAVLAQYGDTVAVRHDGSTSVLDAVFSSTITRPNVFIISRFRTSGGGQYALDSEPAGGGNRTSFFASATSLYTSSGVSLLVDANASEFTAWATRAMVRTAAGGAASYRDGSVVATDPSGGSNMTGIRVGARRDDALFGSLDWVEILVFDDELTTAQLASLQAYAESAYAPILDPDSVALDPTTLDWSGGDVFEGDAIGLTAGDDITTWSGSKGRRVAEQTGASNLKPVYRTSPDRASFDGIDDHLDVDSGAVNGTALTISAVTEAIGSGTMRLAYINNAQIITVSSAGAYDIDVRTVDDGYVATVTDALVDKTARHHVAVTYDGATIRVYVDGTETHTSPATGALDPRAGFPHVLSSTAGSTQFFDGDVLHYGYATEALTPEQIYGIAAHYGATP